MAQELTQERLKELLNYDPETGVFTWMQSGPGVRAGSVAGCTTPDGYRCIRLDGIKYYAHRLAWLYTYGGVPDGKIDHRDQDKANNRITNLRVVTNSQNALNTGLRSTNTSGYKGVTWDKTMQKWLAQIVINNKCRYLGRFTNIVDAISARKAGEESLGVSEFCPQ